MDSEFDGKPVGEFTSDLFGEPGSGNESAAVYEWKYIFLICFDESVTLIILHLCLIGVERFICIFQILMNASRESSVDQTHIAIIRMDLSIAPVSVITSQLQALSTFI